MSQRNKKKFNMQEENGNSQDQLNKRQQERGVSLVPASTR